MNLQIIPSFQLDHEPLRCIPNTGIEPRTATYKVAVLPLNQTGIGNQS